MTIKSHERADWMEKTYTIVLRPEPEGGFTVRVPALPEIVSYGEDEKEALAMAKDAIELCLLSRAERGEEIPDSDHGCGGVVVHSVSVSVAA
jgi:antitoxin HicB